MIHLGLLINDRVLKPANVEQRRNATHGLGMAEANVASRLQAVIEVFSRQAARGVVEIDQHVPAEDKVEVAEMHHVGGVDQIGAGELDRLAKAGIDLKQVGVEWLEIAVD